MHKRGYVCRQAFYDKALVHMCTNWT